MMRLLFRLWRMERATTLPLNMVDIAALRRKLSGYLPPERLRDIDEAYTYSENAHAGQQRASGKPFILHPLTVADILADWRLTVPPSSPPYCMMWWKIRR